jgi:hypothetical protein
VSHREGENDGQTKRQKRVKEKEGILNVDMEIELRITDQVVDKEERVLLEVETENEEVGTVTRTVETKTETVTW